MGIALDLDNDKFFVSKNGTFFSNGTGTQDTALAQILYILGVILLLEKQMVFTLVLMDILHRL